MFFVREGIPFIVVPVVAGLLLILLGGSWPWAVPGWILVGLGLFCAFFFRDPPRRIPAGDHLVLSPCDGTVLEVCEEDGKKAVRVFLSVFNVHLQRSPVKGTVKRVDYRPGRFLPAMNPQAHRVNEQNIITIETARGEFLVKQIAGLIARRVVSWVAPGDQVEPGGKIGLIKFGSQVDLYMPPAANVAVNVGDTVTAGETVIAELR